VKCYMLKRWTFVLLTVTYSTAQAEKKSKKIGSL
jgi:hypothetical protein